MPVTIKISQVNRSLDRAINRIHNVDKEITDELIKLSLKSRDRMRGIIQAKKSREGSNNNLEKNIDVEARIRPQGSVIGIGNIDILDRNARYWFLINYGGMVSPEARFVPGSFGAGNPPSSQFKGTGVGTEKFTYEPGKGTFMRVDSPIAPMNYIELTAVFVNLELRAALSRIARKSP